ncbi:hypothetical protein BDV96DRAFT_641845 [Lophiotrema nucula]|uniref:Uncharacterized protein n=1 Tax=Lophiotrema nucula TaxID=690887 RepID=A0A6A5ZKU7_9PLEO|nr:hypothetical protein BDV96DRAFT_641845 [Lophiotrema nucula]
MSVKSDLRKQLAAICSQAHSNNINFADIIPHEMQDHFSSLRELTAAKAYVKEVEEREKALQSENATLKTDLHGAKQAVADLPDDHKQLKVDLKQAEGRIQFYQGLKEDAEATAESYRRKMVSAMSKQTDSEQAMARIKSLEQECQDLRNSAFKKVKDNRDLLDMLEKAEDKHQKALSEVQAQLQKTCEQLSTQEAHLAALEEESDVFERTTGDVLSRMTEEADEVATVVNTQTDYIRHVQACEAAAATEARFLARWLKGFHSISVSYQKVFRDLVELGTQGKVYLPAHLEASIASAKQELDAFDTMSDALNMEDLDNESVKETRMELAAMAHSAHNLQALMGTILMQIKK